MDKPDYRKLYNRAIDRIQELEQALAVTESAYRKEKFRVVVENGRPAMGSERVTQ